MEDRTRQRARLFTIIGVVLALVAGGGTYLYASSQQSAAPPPEEKGPVIVAVRDLAARQAVSASDIRVEQYPKTVIPPTALTRPEDVVGKILTQPVVRGEPILPHKFAVQQGQAAFSVLPAGEELKPDSPNFRAMSITVADANAVGGNVQPGDFVDILATLNIDPAKFFTTPPDPNRIADFSTKIILLNIPILARQGSVYTIRISDLAIAEKLTYLQASGGQTVMLLRAPKDERQPRTTGVTFEAIYRDFGFPTGRRFSPIQ